MFSDLVSLQYVRPEVGGDILFGNSDLSDVEEADPDDYLNRATEAFVDLTVDKVGTRFPGFTDAAITQQLRGLLRRHAGLEPGDLRDRRSTASSSRPDSAATASRSPLRSADWSPTSSSTAAAPTRGFRETDFRLSRFAEDDLLKTPVSVRRCRADAIDRVTP